jgi:branched-chain amino acid transport system ATP-binding protein
MAAVTLLETAGLSRRFGGLQAVRDVAFRLEEGEIRAVIGPNGAGKTTFVSMISGRVQPSAGTIAFRGRDITALRPWQRVMRGIVYTFQVTSIFRSLSCYENVALPAQRRLMRGPLARLTLREHHVRHRVEAALDAVGLRAESDRRADTLPYGHQRLLEVAMGLALEPQLLILDEPTQGLAPDEITAFCALIRRIAQGATILLIEHNMSVVLELAQRITVLERGAILAEGTPAEIERHPDVQRAYLGG